MFQFFLQLVQCLFCLLSELFLLLAVFSQLLFQGLYFAVLEVEPSFQFDDLLVQQERYANCLSLHHTYPPEIIE